MTQTMWQFVGFLLGVTIVAVIVLPLMLITEEVSRRRRIRESREWWAVQMRNMKCGQQAEVSSQERDSS